MTDANCRIEFTIDTWAGKDVVALFSAAAKNSTTPPTQPQPGKTLLGIIPILLERGEVWEIPGTAVAKRYEIRGIALTEAEIRELATQTICSNDSQQPMIPKIAVRSGGVNCTYRHLTNGQIEGPALSA
ncbi:MAG: hypothetical protein SFW62_09860 [Alphaproteobacteria bacterium]|nr:hypothetical protein [Alphaproteobacteria bacterium]